MSDLVYAKLIFNEFHVEWDQSQGGIRFEIFNATELYANGFEHVPILEEFLKVALYDWGCDIVEIKDKNGNVLYPTQ